MSTLYLALVDGELKLVESTGGGGGEPSDGNKGDITVASSGSSWTINNGAVDLAALGGDITAAGKALLDDADAAAQRTTLGLGTAATQASSAFQAADATLSAIAALTILANSLLLGTGTDAFAVQQVSANQFLARASSGDLGVKTISDFGLSLVDDANAAAGRTTLELGSADTPTFAGLTSGPITINSNTDGTVGIDLISTSGAASSPNLHIRGRRTDGNTGLNFAGQLFLSKWKTVSAHLANSHLGGVMFGGNHTDGTAPNIAFAASIVAQSAGPFNSAADMPTRLHFRTSSNGDARGTNSSFGGDSLVIHEDGVSVFCAGGNTRLARAGGSTPRVQSNVNNTNASTNGFLGMVFSATSSQGPGLYLGKAASNTFGTYSAVSTGHLLGLISFEGADGTDMEVGARIRVECSSGVGAGVVPSTMMLQTANTSGVLNTALSIDHNGIVSIGANTSFDQTGANDENPTVSQFIVTNGSDGRLRKASASHAMQQARATHIIASQAIATGTNTTTFNLPSGAWPYVDLVIVGLTAGTDFAPYLRINGDSTGGNYRYAGHTRNLNTGTGGTQSGGTTPGCINLFSVATTCESSSGVYSCTVRIYNPASTTVRKTMDYRIGATIAASDGVYYGIDGSAAWLSTAAITSITLHIQNAGGTGIGGSGVNATGGTVYLVAPL